MKKFSFGLIVVLVFVYFMGPQFEKPNLTAVLPDIDLELASVENYVQKKEAKFNIRPDNEARIVWNNDSLKEKTEYCVLYLHGFSATWYEGFPSHLNFAKSINANVYLSRLAAHGLAGDDALLEMTPSSLYESAKEALLIALQLGDKVILMGTSTGGTLALKLAADFPDKVNSLFLLSPNVAINNPAAFLLDKHWGLQIARISGGGGKNRIFHEAPDLEQKYWNQEYRWEATVYLQQLIVATMTPEVFQKIRQPLFLGYYYKNEKEQDPVVRVDALLQMFNLVNTPDALKHKVAFPDAGDHVIACEATSGCAGDVEKEMIDFMHTTVEPFD
jgi:pimeloyl-ACP methyl ester carboxylesterase